MHLARLILVTIVALTMSAAPAAAASPADVSGSWAGIVFYRSYGFTPAEAGPTYALQTFYLQLAQDANGRLDGLLGVSTTQEMYTLTGRYGVGNIAIHGVVDFGPLIDTWLLRGRVDGGFMRLHGLQENFSPDFGPSGDRISDLTVWLWKVPALPDTAGLKAVALK